MNTTEFFPPNEEELEQMISDLKEQIDNAESQLEYNELKIKLQELENQHKKLILKNNLI